MNAGIGDTYSGLQSLLAAMPAPVWLGLGRLDAPVLPTVPLVLVLPEPPDPDTVDRLRQHLLGGGRAVVAVTAQSAEFLPVGSLVLPGAETLAGPDADDPLVLDPHLRGHGRDTDELHLDGLVLEADDLIALRTSAATPLVIAAAEPVMVSVPVGEGTLVVLGSVGALSNAWIAASDNATLVHRALFGRSAPTDDATTNPKRVVRRHRPRRDEATRGSARSTTPATTPFSRCCPRAVSRWGRPRSSDRPPRPGACCRRRSTTRSASSSTTARLPAPC